LLIEVGDVVDFPNGKREWAEAEHGVLVPDLRCLVQLFGNEGVHGENVHQGGHYWVVWVEF